MKIQILGPGCARCGQTAKIVAEAVAETGIQAEIVKVTDVMEIAKSGVFGTPAVIIDGRVKAVGKVPGKKEVLGWLRE
ncbi:MAG: TM0996/MTH895 family glutaredoxin-like protein [Deltaproteobacteria bacterium]|nr:TM0996/MTH895 family glutaredoxin-like protein [Deltaproteobacteria bacterium]